MLVLEKVYAPDSGGPGQFRGGLGQRVRFRKIAEDGLEMLVSCYPEGVNNPIEGLFGGKPGGAASGRILDPQGQVTRDVGTGDLLSITGTDQIVEIVLAGGAGYGPASDRDPAAVSRDLALGYITPDHARSEYGTAAKLAEEAPVK